MEMSWLVIVSLVVLGIVFLLLEILVVPGTTIVGLVGLGMLIAAVVISFGYGTTEGIMTLAGTLILSLLAIALALKSNTWKKAMLGTEISGKVNELEKDIIQPGQEGITVSRLNPVGKALIGDDYYEVRSSDNLIPENTPIVVFKVDGNRIIVKPKS